MATRSRQRWSGRLDSSIHCPNSVGTGIFIEQVNLCKSKCAVQSQLDDPTLTDLGSGRSAPVPALGALRVTASVLVTSRVKVAAKKNGLSNDYPTIKLDRMYPFSTGDKNRHAS